MKVLVTGANGQLGSEIKEISDSIAGSDFIFTDVDSLDITNEDAINIFFSNNKPDFVVNCAAYTAVDKAEEQVERATEINVKAVGLIAKACQKYEAKLIHISTDYVFDGKGYEPYRENDAVNPSGVYGVTKYKSETESIKYNPQTIILRTSWLYSFYGQNFVKTMIRLGRERDELKVVFDQIGTPTYAGDLARAILKIIKDSIKQSSNFVSGIYHYSNEGVCSWYDFSLAVHELAEIECIINPVESGEFKTVAKRPHYSVLNKSKIKSIYNIQIPYWRDSLKLCIARLLKE